DGIDDGPVGLAVAGLVKSTVKAAFAPRMAGNSAFLVDFIQNDVAVAVETDFVHDLDVAGLLSLAPQPVARARPVDGAAGGGGFGQRLGVGVGEHHHRAGGGVLGNDGNQAFFIEGQFG